MGSLKGWETLKGWGERGGPHGVGEQGEPKRTVKGWGEPKRMGSQKDGWP